MEKRFTRRAVLLVLGGLALCALAVAVPTQGGVNPSQTTRLTFSQPIALPGVTLAAGTYVFERANPIGAIDIVRVTSGDRRFVVYMGYTELVQRERPGSNQIVFGEAPRGSATPIREWYPTGSVTGHRFLYR
jgi:hypothetical protein